jgi:hypothetical protein
MNQDLAEAREANVGGIPEGPQTIQVARDYDSSATQGAEP